MVTRGRRRGDPPLAALRHTRTCSYVLDERSDSPVSNPLQVSEAAVIGFPHDTKGEGICCYVTLKHGVEETAEVAAELRQQVRHKIGPFATPDFVVLTSALPKTRSGKIMRRVLRKIIAGQTDQIGDISTLADPGVVAELIEKVGAMLAAGRGAAPAAARTGTQA